MEVGVVIPCGLVVRIRRSHRRGRGSIPRMGVPIFFFSFFFSLFFYTGQRVIEERDHPVASHAVYFEPSENPDIKLLEEILQKAQKIKLTDEVMLNHS